MLHKFCLVFSWDLLMSIYSYTDSNEGYESVEDSLEGCDDMNQDDLMPKLINHPLFDLPTPVTSSLPLCRFFTRST